MGKFTFRLEGLLNIANHQEDEAKKQLSVCLQELKKNQEQLSILSQKQCQALRLLVEDQKGVISIHKLINNHQYCQYLKKEVEKQQREVICFEAKVEEARAILQEAMKKRKILDRLKENKLSLHFFEQEKDMQKEMDEIASNLFFASIGGL